MNDTDSCGYTLQPIIDMYFKDKSNQIEIVKKIDAEIVGGIIEKTCKEIQTNYNWKMNTLSMKTEAISSTGFVCAKKRYCFDVIENEGVRYAEPKLKIIGLDIKKGNVPAIVKRGLRRCIEIVLREDQEKLIEYFDEYKKEYYNAAIEEIAYSTQTKDFKKYSSDGMNTIGKSVPIAARTAANHNRYVIELKLQNKYKLIESNEKFKMVYLDVRNPTKQDVMGFLGKLPKEFNLHSKVDYNKMFEKSFISPLEKITHAIGWKYQKCDSLDDLF
jgi:DNA polymerase elongation subunit (family B)